MTEPVDLTNCDREPIHVPAAIQPHGILLAFAASGLTVASANAHELGALPALGAHLDDSHLTQAVREEVAALLADPTRVPESLSIEHRGRTYDVVSHRSDGLLVLELEVRELGTASLEAAALAAQRAIVRIQGITDRTAMLATVAREVRKLTGFDRVMVYRFQHDGSGIVEAEDRRVDLEPFLGLHYPASDIPAQARRLYVLNPLRLIADTAYRAVELEPALDAITKRPLDLSQSILRSVSPIHIEYLTNMGVHASMSISIVIDGRLWGLVVCHHASPRLVSYAVRMSCQLMAQVVSIIVDRAETAHASAELERTIRLQTELCEQIVGLGDLPSRLTEGEKTLLDLVAADGAVVVVGTQIRSVGRVPSEGHITTIVDWLAARGAAHFETAHPAEDCAALVPALDGLCGLLALRFSEADRGHVLWFRAEERELVRWAGEPKKVYSEGPLGATLTPRGSFDEWLETVVDRSAPWTARELEVAGRLSVELGAIAFAQARARIMSLEQSNAELDRLAYVVSHDLRAPLRAVANLTQFIEEDLAEGKSSEALVHAGHARLRVQKLDDLVVAALGYARSGQTRESAQLVDVGVLVRDTIELLYVSPRIRIEVEPTLPSVLTHAIRLQQVFMNLIVNATKYGVVHEQGRIQIGAIDRGNTWEFFVRDEGPGIAPEHFDRIFELFVRLASDGSGSGVGLAIVRRIAETHGGRAWVESVPGKGATFRFTWAKHESERSKSSPA